MELALDGDVELAETILEDALARGVPVGPLDGFAGSHGTGPRHVGATLLHRARAGPAGETGPAVLLVPRHADRMWPLERPSPRPSTPRRDRILYVASGDLSHRLTPEAPAGYDPLGQEFDERVVAAFSEGTAEAMLACRRVCCARPGSAGTARWW